MVRYWLIVARDQLNLFDFWTLSLLGSRDVQVMVDRRKEERRHGAAAHRPERRQADRRQTAIDDKIRLNDFVIVRRQPETASG